MVADLNSLAAKIDETFAGAVSSVSRNLDELTIVVRAADAHKLFVKLRDDGSFGFEQLIDLCGIDYSAYGSEHSESGVYLASEVSEHQNRFAVVYHLLSVANNVRLRVRVYAEQDDFPRVDSVADVWPNANWYEREAFDLFGIVFVGHPDLRRLLTDYGFVGNPFRKDFPLSGNVEMRYDTETKRVIYQPVSVEPRQITPRSIREESYGRH